MTLLLALGAALAWRYRDRAAVSAARSARRCRSSSSSGRCSSGRPRRDESLLRSSPWPSAWRSRSGRGPPSASPGSGSTRTCSGDCRTSSSSTRTRSTSSRSTRASSTLARAIWLAVGVAVLAAVVVVARRGDERRAFVLAVARPPPLADRVVALLRAARRRRRARPPRLSLAWFVPLAMVVTPGSGQPTPFETSATLVIAAVTVALSLWSIRAPEAGASWRGAGMTSSAIPRRATRRASSLPFATVRGRSSCGARWPSGRSSSSGSCATASCIPRRATRPREHGAGGLEHGRGAPARGHARRDGRADDPARWPRRPVPRAARARVARLAVTARAGARADRRRRRSARSRCSGSPGSTSRRREPPASSRSRTSRIRGSPSRRPRRSTRSRSRSRSSSSASGSSTPVGCGRSRSVPRSRCRRAS